MTMPPTMPPMWSPACDPERQEMINNLYQEIAYLRESQASDMAMIAQLKHELDVARAALLLIAKDAPSICALLMADESFAAALKAAREAK